MMASFCRHGYLYNFLVLYLVFILNNNCFITAKPQNNGKSRRQYLPQPKERRPNIVLIMTDDQDVELGSLNFMPRTLRLLRDGGAEFRHAYTTTPMCCPSRSSMLTGLYMHNHEVYTNNGNCSSQQWQTTHETKTFATYLSNAGYRTGYFGKYLNKYNGSYIPPGWREWGGLIMNSRYYNYSVNLNGRRIKHGDDYHKDYYPDLIANDSVAFLRQSKQYFSRKPVMLVLGFPAPHGPEDSAPQYSNLFFNVTSHHTPSYDYAPNPDKQWILQVTGPMRPIHRQFTDLLMTKRLQTLQSVDDAVEKIYQELKALGELDNTYIIYTSDHGYHLGQFGLVKGKSFPFEFDIRVPFLVRGPGIEPGTIIDELVLNIDLAPTFLDIAGVEAPPHMDGRSFLKLLNRRHKPRTKFPNKWPDTFLIESSGRRDGPELITEGKLKESITKLEKDVNQTLNSHVAPVEKTFNDSNSVKKSENEGNDFEQGTTFPSPKGIESANDGQLDNQLPPVIGISKMERLAIECQRPEYQPPCKQGQKWQCLAEGNRWRKHKCKLRANVFTAPRGKKCACFTPTGFMYTKYENERRTNRDYMRSSFFRDVHDFKPKYVRTFRTRRSANQDLPPDIDTQSEFTLLLKPTDDGKLKFVKKNNYQASNINGNRYNNEKEDPMEVLSTVYRDYDISKAIDSVIASIQNNKPRTKRSNDALDLRVSTMMGVLEDRINILQVSGNETYMKINSEGNCTLGNKGEVSCSEAVYHDPKIWKASRDHLDEQIKKLKAHIDKLKEIRRHLKEKRPHHIPYDHSNEDEEESDKENFTEINLPTTTEELLHMVAGELETSTESNVRNKTDLQLPSVNADSSTNAEIIIVTTTELPIKISNATLEVFLSHDGQQRKKNRHRHHHTLVHSDDKSLFNGGSTSGVNYLNTGVEQDSYGGNTFRIPSHVGTNVQSRIDIADQDPVIAQTPNHPEKFVPDTCYCERDIPLLKDERELAREARRKLKEERLRKRERKLRRKAKFESECLSEKMNCFNHDNEHWKTPPLWTEGPFCFCMNANNNTYSCLRTINATHNFLYCEFVTGLITYYNLRIDPFEQWNRINTLTKEEKSYLHDQLEHLKSCKGVRQCTVGSAQNSFNAPPITKPPKRRKFPGASLLVPSFHSHSYSRLVKHSQRNMFRNKSFLRQWRRRHGGPYWKNKRRQSIQQTRTTTLAS
ncbi:extracellular sulfatase SULF-1 homolog isoform X1 [Rhodnius prolixus]